MSPSLQANGVGLAESNLADPEASSNGHKEYDQAAIVGEKTEDASEKPIPRGSKKPLVLKTALIAVVAALLAALGYQKYRPRVRGPPEGVPPIGGSPKALREPDSVRAAIADLEESLQELQTRWETSSQLVRNTFAREFTPTLDEDDAPSAQPMEMYLRHWRSLLERRPSLQSASEQQLMDYLTEVKLLTFVYSGAAARLGTLHFLERSHVEAGLGIPILGLPDQVQYPTQYEPGAKEASVSFEEFVRMFPEMNVSSELFATVRGKTVPAELAYRLYDCFRPAQMDFDDSYAVTDFFGPVLNHLGLSYEDLDSDEFTNIKPLSIAGGREYFDLLSFGRFLKVKRNQHDAMGLSFLQFLAENWTDAGIRSKIQEVRARHERQLEENRQVRRQVMKDNELPKPLAREHLQALAVFLI